MEEDKLTESMVQQILMQSRAITMEQFNEMMKEHPPVTTWTSATTATMGKPSDCRIDDRVIDSSPKSSKTLSPKTLLDEIIGRNKNLLLLELPIQVVFTRSGTGIKITDKLGKEFYLEKDAEGYNLQEEFGI